jgi:type II secretory pathway component PulK
MIVVDPNSSMAKPRLRRSERGSILLLSFLLLALMMVFVADATQVAAIEYEASLHGANDLKLEAALRYGYETARAHLQQDQSDTEIDSLAEEWNTPLELQVADPAAEKGGRAEVETDPYAQFAGGSGATEGVKVTIEIEDEERKWPLGLLVVNNEAQQRRRREGLVAVIRSCRQQTVGEIDGGTAERMADLIMAFMQRKEGESSGPVPRAPTKSPLRIFSVTELALIPELDDSLMFDQVDEEGRVIPGLSRFLSVHSDLQININTAPLAVLRGLFRADDAIIADNIYDYRVRQDEELAKKGDSLSERAAEQEREAARESGAPSAGGAEGEEPTADGAIFQKVEDVRTKVTGFSDRAFRETSTVMTVNSNTFSIYVTAAIGDIARTRRYVVRRGAAGMILVLSEKIDQDFRPRYRIKEEPGAEGSERRKAAAERKRERLSSR